MLRDGGSADRQLVRELADRARMIGETLEDRAPREAVQGCAERDGVERLLDAGVVRVGIAGRRLSR
jgi:hypothetical protein